jgi:cytoskeletal protein RodZ
MSFGEELRRERELREITLGEIARATKIDTRCLEALESNDFAVLPEGLYRRGFIRAYCQHIGVDPESMVNAYLLEERTQSVLTEAELGIGEVIRGSDINRAQDEENEAEVRMQAALLRLRRRKMLQSMLLVLVLVTLVGVAGYRWIWPMFSPPHEATPRPTVTEEATRE